MTTPPPPARNPEPALPAVLAARRLILVLDYDGTLVPLASSPEQAVPDDALLELLCRLAARRRTEVHILSGRTTAFLERWFGTLPLHLHAEHGAYSRAAGRQEWERRPIPAPSWQEAVRPVLADFARRTPGATVEVKESSLAWHWRRADAEVGSRQANELGLQLGRLLGNLPLELMWGDRVLEILPHGVNKGVVSGELAATLSAGSMVVAMGDDRTDEDLFAALPPESVTIVIGERPSRARFRLRDAWEARAFLARLLPPRA